MRSSLRFGGDCRHILIGGESQPVSALLPADGTGEVIADNDVGVGLPAEAFTNPAEVTATDRTGTIVMCAAQVTALFVAWVTIPSVLAKPPAVRREYQGKLMVNCRITRTRGREDEL